MPLTNTETGEMDTSTGNSNGHLDEDEQRSRNLMWRDLYGPPLDQNHYNNVMYDDPAGQSFASQYPSPERFQYDNIMYNNPEPQQTQNQYPSLPADPNAAIGTQSILSMF
jgi:hypothetical protein